jgi:hypothetical protein
VPKSWQVQFRLEVVENNEIRLLQEWRDIANGEIVDNNEAD